MIRLYQLQISIQPAFFVLVFLFCLPSVYGQIMVNHVNDFQNLTTSGWMEGGVSPNPPTIISTGGPGVGDDAFLRNISSGTSESGGKWVMFNQTAAWTGNYQVAGVTRLSMDVRNAGSTEIHLRISFNGSGGGISSDTAYTLAPDNLWQTVEFAISPLRFIALMGGGNISATLSAVSEFRILSNSNPGLNGEEIAATVDIDNIRAESTSAVSELTRASWIVWPNPAHDEVNLSHPDHVQSISVNVSDVLGRVHISNQILTRPFALDVSAMLPGMYLMSIDGGVPIPILKGR